MSTSKPAPTSIPLDHNLVLLIHKSVGDMLVLNQKYPAVMQWLQSRLEADFDMAHNVVLVPRLTCRPIFTNQPSMVEAVTW
jgi:hypothetical protein